MQKKARSFSLNLKNQPSSTAALPSLLLPFLRVLLQLESTNCKITQDDESFPGVRELTHRPLKPLDLPQVIDNK